MTLQNDAQEMTRSMIITQPGTSFWMPIRASEWASEVDWVFHFIFWVSFVFFALIVGLMVLFVIRYRRRIDVQVQPTPSYNLALELTWSVIPLALVITIFYFGFRGFMKITVMPLNAYEIHVTGRKWKWLFSYPNGLVDENLHLPVDRNVLLVITSEDVIHSLFIPAFRLKRDAVPGRYAKVTFRPVLTGKFDLLCAEYCGRGHSQMYTKAIVHPPGEFEKWLEDASNLLATIPAHEAGERLYKTRGCAQCHSVDGRAGIGPTFKGLFGSKPVLKDGSQILADENYIRESIIDPQAKIVAGFQPVMSTYKGLLTDQDITNLIAYIKTLKD